MLLYFVQSSSFYTFNPLPAYMKLYLVDSFTGQMFTRDTY